MSGLLVKVAMELFGPTVSRELRHPTEPRHATLLSHVRMDA